MVDNFLRYASLEEVAASLTRFDNFYITGHRNPDGDSIGSCECLRLALIKIGKNAISSTSKLSDGEMSEFIKSRFCFIQLDVQPQYRIVDEDLAIKQKADFTICIDHHPKEEPNCNLVYVDKSAAANALNVWSLVQLLDLEIDKDIAHWAYYGLSSDTNSFMNTNTDIRCFEAALQMLKYNIDVSQIAQDLFQSRTLESFEIEKVVLQNLFVDKKNRFALSFITSDDYKKYNATKDDSDASINLLRELACVDVACILRQEKDGEKIHGSLRSKTKTDVSMLAKKHVGGGHRAAAGFTMETSDIQEAIEIVKAQLCDLMQG